MKRTAKIYLFIIVLILANGYALAQKTIYDKQISFPREIFNFHVVAPGIMRGSQPSKEAFGLLKEYCQVKTVLSFRGEKEHNAREKEIVEKLGMNFINIPMSGGNEQSIETIEQCLNIVNDKAKQPIFVHCQAGKDRTGMIFAAYRIKYNHWSLEDALMEMLLYGYDRAGCFPLEKSLIEWNKKTR